MRNKVAEAVPAIRCRTRIETSIASFWQWSWKPGRRHERERFHSLCGDSPLPISGVIGHRGRWFSAVFSESRFWHFPEGFIITKDTPAAGGFPGRGDAELGVEIFIIPMPAGEVNERIAPGILS